MRVVALSKLFALRYAPELDKSHIIISILEPKAEPIEFPPNKTRLAVLSINFYDLDYNPERWGEKDTEEIVEQYGHGIFTVQQANTIIDFVEQWKDSIKLVVVHCEAGISRSAGVAAAISKVLTGSDEKIFNSKWHIPNMYVYRTILEEWMKRK